MIGNLEQSLEKAEQDKQAKENQIGALQDEMNNQDESIGKLNKEKKHQEEVCRFLVSTTHSHQSDMLSQQLHNFQKRNLDLLR